MEPGCTNLTEAVRSVHQLRINGYSATASGCMKTKWIVDGCEWEIKFYPALGLHGRSRRSSGTAWWVALKLILLSEPRESDVTASLSCRLLDPSGDHGPSEETVISQVFKLTQDESDPVCLIRTEDLRASGFLKDDSLTIECTITVVQELPDVVIADNKKQNEPLPTMPSSDLHLHLGELLQSQKGADVTFDVSGESFAAHKLVLAARSPVFMAEFFGAMEERSSRSVVIEDMEATVFKAMLHFIYTDTVPELAEDPDAAELVDEYPDAAELVDVKPEAAGAVMAQHLLAAADRYGLQRLKVICEGKLCGGIGVDTAATTLALAEQHNCSLLRAKCVEFITASPETLDAVVETEGYKHLVASCPLVFTELLKAAHGRKR